jgi:hypothetical protein
MSPALNDLKLMGLPPDILDLPALQAVDFGAAAVGGPVLFYPGKFGGYEIPDKFNIGIQGRGNPDIPRRGIHGQTEIFYRFIYNLNLQVPHPEGVRHSRLPFNVRPLHKKKPPGKRR